MRDTAVLRRSGRTARCRQFCFRRNGRSRRADLSAGAAAVRPRDKSLRRNSCRLRAARKRLCGRLRVRLNGRLCVGLCGRLRIGLCGRLRIGLSGRLRIGLCRRLCVGLNGRLWSGLRGSTRHTSRIYFTCNGVCPRFRLFQADSACKFVHIITSRKHFLQYSIFFPIFQAVLQYCNI